MHARQRQATVNGPLNAYLACRYGLQWRDLAIFGGLDQAFGGISPHAWPVGGAKKTGTGPVLFAAQLISC
jgi:hypothetical protein